MLRVSNNFVYDFESWTANVFEVLKLDEIVQQSFVLSHC